MPTGIAELLKADLDHFGQSLWRNDDMGERRFNFFLTVTTSVIGGLAALYAARDLHAEPGVVAWVTRTGLVGLCIFGMMTYLRLLQKNRITEEHHDTLRYIRKKLVSLDPAAGVYEVPQRPPRTVRWLKGGLAETTGLMTAAVFALLIYSVAGEVLPGLPQFVVATGAGTVAAAFLFHFAVRRSRGPAQYFRAGAGAVIINSERKVLALQRTGTSDRKWQMPQGGLEMLEEPLQAIYREIFEETGIPEAGLSLLQCCPDPLVYELPAGMRSAKTGRGQVQHWFLFELQTSEATIELKNGGEFAACCWMPPDKLLAETVDFRRPVYGRIFDFFAPQLAEPSGGSRSATAPAQGPAQR